MKLWMAPAGLHVEPARLSDAKAMAHMHAKSFFHGWAMPELEAYISTPAATPVYIACDARNRVAGFMVFRLAADEAELLTIAVDKRWRRKGVGAALIKAGLDDLMMTPATKVFLEVDRDNDAAIKLYRRHGFDKVAERQGYYTLADGRSATALVMRCDVN